MAYPTLSVQVAFDDDPLDTTVTWTDITTYVRSIRTKVGRDTELQGFDPGTCILELDNTGRLFDPLYASGTYYGKLTAGKRMRVRATHDAVTYVLFVGWVEGWPQDYSSQAPTITVACSDALKQLARLPLPESVFERTVTADAPWAWWRLRDQAGTDVEDSSGNRRTAELTTGDWGEIERVPLPIDGSKTVLAVSNQNVSSPWEVGTGRFPAPGAGDEISWEAWVQISPVTGWDYYVSALLRDRSSSGGVWNILAGQSDSSYDRRLTVHDGGGANWKRTTTDVINDGSLHLLCVTADGTTIKFYVDGQEKLQTTVGSGPGVPPDVWWWRFPSAYSALVTGGADLSDVFVSIGEVQLYGRVLSSLEVLDHYVSAVKPWTGDTTGERIDRVLAWFSWPALLKDIATGITTLGAAWFRDARTALDYLRRVAAAEQGHLYADPANDGKVTYRDRHHRLTTSRSTTVQATLSDENTTGVYFYESLDLRYDDEAIVNAVDVRWAGGTASVEDANSVTAYGRSALTVDTELATYAEAENLGQWIVGRYKDPIARCRRVEFNCAAYQPAFDLLDLRIGDRVTVRKLPQGVGAAIEKDLLVEGIEHDISLGVNRWTTTFKTSEAEAGPWFVWDTATWDETTRWAW